MTLLPTIDLRAYKNTTLYIAGIVTRFGERRNVVEKGDLLEFVISEDEDGPVILSRNSLLGIEVAETGDYVILIPASDMTVENFPNNHYFYRILITEGDTSHVHPVDLGHLHLEDLP